MSTPKTPQVPPNGADVSVDPAVAGRAAFPELPAAPAVPAKSRKHIYFGLGGLAVGLAAGLIFGVLVAGAAADRADAEAQASAEASAQAETQAIAEAIPAAVEKCSATSDKSVEVMDGGRSVSMSTTGKKSTGTSITTVVCVLDGLGSPDSLYSKLESTRALDGTKSADWPGFAASWTYHPDNGLNIIVETAVK